MSCLTSLYPVFVIYKKGNIGPAGGIEVKVALCHMSDFTVQVLNMST